MNSNNVLRQIKDIQMQCEAIIVSKEALSTFQDLEKYSREIIKYLEENVTDETLLSHIAGIPHLNPNLVRKEQYWFERIIFFIAIIISAGTLASYFNTRQENEEMLDQIRELKNKYASLEFLLKNYF